jgi:hypothetical protein
MDAVCWPPADSATGALPNLIVIGAMKSGTSALHRHLDCHPEIGMSRPKELNFFFGPVDSSCPGTDRHVMTCECPQRWAEGNYHRGIGWYASQFDARLPVRGESSPQYTSPSRASVAVRMAQVVPEARLLYLVRDPLARAVSQYRHHHREGTERRPMHEALFNPSSQYISRGQYFQRLLPFLERFGKDQIAIVAQEELLADPHATLPKLFGFLGVDDSYWSSHFQERLNQAPEGPPPPLDGWLRDRLIEAFHDDAERLRTFADRSFRSWSV